MTAYLQVTMTIDPADRAAGAKVYSDYLQEFLDTVPGARTKELLVRDEDVQVLHGFETPEQANAYLSSELFTTKVVPGLTPLFKADPDIRFRAVAWLERIRRGGGLARIEARSRPVLTRRRWSSAGCSSVRAR